MDNHDELENILYTLEQMLPVSNVKVEFALNSVVHENTRADTVLVIFVVPVVSCLKHGVLNKLKRFVYKKRLKSIV